MRQAHRASIFHFIDDPDSAGADAYAYFDDGGIVIEEGVVADLGAWADIDKRLPSGTQVTQHKASLIVPGFVDTHIHYPQLDIIGSPSGDLMSWLTIHTYPSEVRFRDPVVARETARFFIDELLRNGTTTALVFATVHRASVDALFEAAFARNMRLIAGKVLMDRHAPRDLCETAEQGDAESRALIAAWHGKGRLAYAITPRFAVTSSERQLELTSKILSDHPTAYLQTHLSESEAEIAEVRRLFPDCADYLAVYEKFALVREQSLFAHAIHLSQSEWQRLGAKRAAVAFCPTSNLFLGSGLFDLNAAEAANVKVGLGTDVGGGTSFSLFQTMNEAHKVCQLRHHKVDPLKHLYLATLGGARALRLDKRIGNLLPGKEADFLVLDLAATPLIARRASGAKSIEERLFALSTLGDDRLVSQTFVAGSLAHTRAQ
jgi:guanine deaminase